MSSTVTAPMNSLVDSSSCAPETGTKPHQGAAFLTGQPNESNSGFGRQVFKLSTTKSTRRRARRTSSKRFLHEAVTDSCSISSSLSDQEPDLSLPSIPDLDGIHQWTVWLPDPGDSCGASRPPLRGESPFQAELLRDTLASLDEELRRLDIFGDDDPCGEESDNDEEEEEEGGS